MSIASIIANLPALVVVIPLLLAPIAALIPISGAAWLVAVIGSGGALVSAFLLQGGSQQRQQFQLSSSAAGRRPGASNSSWIQHQR